MAVPFQHRDAELDAFLEIDGIKGESLDGRKEGLIQLEGFSWGAHQREPSPGRYSRSGKCQIENFTVTKRVDRSSPAILSAVTQCRTFKTVKISTRKAGGTQLVFLEIDFYEVVVASWTLSATKSDGIPLEHITFAFLKFNLKYRPQSSDGKAGGGAIETMYDIASAREER